MNTALKNCPYTDISYKHDKAVRKEKDKTDRQVDSFMSSHRKEKGLQEQGNYIFYFIS